MHFLQDTRPHATFCSLTSEAKKKSPAIVSSVGYTLASLIFLL
jgi:hypothetical protein